MTASTPLGRDDPGVAVRAQVHAALGDPLRLAVVEALLHGDLAPDEIAVALGVGSNALAHHLQVLVDAGLVVRQRSHGDGRRRYVQLCAAALDDLVVPRLWTARQVLFVCSANAARSQMAAALWRSRSVVPAASAGRHPAAAVADGAVAAARAHGLSLEGAVPRGYGDVEGDPDLVISVCDLAREAPIPFTAPRLHWSVPDPLVDGRAAAFEAAFDALDARIGQLAPYVSPCS